MKDLLNRNYGKQSIIALVVLVAMALMVYSTPYGVGLGFDSVAYISAARNLLDGIGLGRITCAGFKPMTLWPPFYPITLAVLALLGFDPIRSAHIVSVAGYAVTLFVAIWFILRISKKYYFLFYFPYCSCPVRPL